MVMRRKSGSLLIAAGTIIAALPAGAQVQWMRQGGIGGMGRGIATDPSGHVLVAGVVNAPALFDTDTMPSYFADVFLARYDELGNIQWVRTGGAELIDQANDVVVDANGNAYITGFFNTNGPNPTVHFDDQELTGLGSSDLFVAKYDASGALIWIRSGGGALAGEGGGIALTPAGDVVVSGFFQGTAVFGTDTLTSAGMSDVMITSIDADGTFLWSRGFGGAGDDMASKLTVLPDGDIAVVGDFQQSIAFGMTTLEAGGLGDIFIARFDANGDAEWAARAGSGIDFAMDRAFDIDHAANGDLLFCGEIAGAAAFDGMVLEPNGGVDLFIARYDGDGNALWAHHAGGPQVDHAYGIAVDAEGNSFLTGQVDDGANTVFDDITLEPFGNEAVFLAKYDASGAVQWVRRYAPGMGGAVEVLGGDCLYFTGGASGIVGQPAFDLEPWQYTDRAIFTARFCEAFSTDLGPGNDVDAVVLYPNPARGEVHIRLPNGSRPVRLEMIDATGRRVRSEVSSGPVRWPVDGLADGLYEIRLDPSTTARTYRLMVMH